MTGREAIGVAAEKALFVLLGQTEAFTLMNSDNQDARFEGLSWC